MPSRLSLASTRVPGQSSTRASIVAVPIGRSGAAAATRLPAHRALLPLPRRAVNRGDGQVVPAPIPARSIAAAIPGRAASAAVATFACRAFLPDPSSWSPATSARRT